MEDINRSKRPNQHATYTSHRSQAAAAPVVNHISQSEVDLDEYVKAIKKRRGTWFSRARRFLKKDFKSWGWNIGTIITVIAVMFSVALPFLQEGLNHVNYKISHGEEGVLLKTNDYMSKKLIYDGKERVYNFNQDYTPRDPGSDLGAGGSLIKAKLYEDPTQGVQITDPVNKIDFTLKPLFWVGNGKQQQNRVVYPAPGGGHLVYTAGAIGIKEDITVPQFVEDTMTYSYELELGDQFDARLTSEGAVGIYGSSLPINGNVSTGSDKDAALLAKARKVAKKDKLLFTLPVPTIKESNNHKSLAKAHFELKGNKLTVHTEHLKQAAFPISIDPTITATAGSTGNGLFSFDANIETNVYVDLANNNYISRSPLTGGNLLSWTSSSSAAAAHFLGGALIYAGTLYVIGGASTTTTTLLTGSNYVEQAKINSDGTIGTFSDGNATGLPAGGIARFQLLTYNGYMYIVDGITSFTSTVAGGTVSDAVYYTRITSESFGAFANGAQLKDWSTTTNKPSTAVYNYGATVYNGVMYVAGGYDSAGTVQSIVNYNVISPSGDLSSAWGTTLALSSGSSARAGFTMQSYNGHIYVLGGNTGNVNTTTLSSGTYYASIASDGSIADTTWKTGSTLVSSNGAATQAMENLGAQFSMIYNGYLYLTGGCGTVNSNGACTNVLNYAQLAQLNADGSLGTFFPNDFQNGGTATLSRIGTPTFGYNGNMYSIAGCSGMPTGAVRCNATSLTTNYAAVNGTTPATLTTGVGDISNNRNPTSLPVGLYGHSTVVLNGYLYVIGGCLSVSCNGVRSANYITYYNPIGADGSLSGSWSWSTTANSAIALHFDGANGDSTCNTAAGFLGSGGNDQCGLAGAAAAVYNGYIYVVGGYDGSAYNSAVYYMSPNSDGSINAWTKSAIAIQRAVTELGAFTYNGSLYIAGGCYNTTGIGCSSYETQVQRSQLNLSTGAPGVFTNVANNNNGTQQLQLGSTRSAFGLTLSGNYIYLAGGIESSTTAQLDTVARAKINSSGDIVNVSTGANTGGWTDCSGTMTKARRRTVAQIVNGYLYVIGGHNADDTTGPPGGADGTTYGDIQIGQIDMSTGGTGDIASFTASATSTLTARWNPAVVFGNGFMYVTGGCTAGPPPTGCTTIGTTDESFVVYNANNLGVNTWNAPTHYYSSGTNGDTSITNRVGAAITAYNGYLYVAGGCTAFNISTGNCTTQSTDMVYASINADGTLGTWQTGSALPYTGGLAFSGMVAIANTLYYIGGISSTNGAVSNVYYATINTSTGQPSVWTQTTTSLLTPRGYFATALFANRIYLIGGQTTAPVAAKAEVYYSPSLANGGNITGAWTQATSSITTARKDLSVVAAGAYLFILGGTDGTNYFRDVQVAKPNTSTGDITSWSRANDLPVTASGMSVIGANGYIYAFGGRNGSTSTSCSNLTYYTTVNADGTTNNWLQAPNKMSTARFGAGTAYSNGYLYTVGGHDCSSIIDTTGSRKVIEQSGQLSEAMHATYTRYVDFGTDATLRQLYVLGTNAQISGTDIDIWNIIVKTSTSYNNSWGQKYTTSLTGLGTGPNYGSPITFQALDGSGTNTGAAQYWDITFDIDQAKSFNFPDTTQPQITKYDFYFSPGPGKRLRDGKTFINELQTNLDAHP